MRKTFLVIMLLASPVFAFDPVEDDPGWTVASTIRLLNSVQVDFPGGATIEETVEYLETHGGTPPKFRVQIDISSIERGAGSRAFETAAGKYSMMEIVSRLADQLGTAIRIEPKKVKLERR